MKTLDTTLVKAPVTLLLCTSETRYTKTLRKLDVPEYLQPPWLKPGADASFHQFTSGNDHIFLICVNVASIEDGVQLVGLVVHEVVHAWGEIQKLIGETDPSSEFSAYSIQSLTMTCLNELRAFFK